MTELPRTEANIAEIQAFINETKNRISEGVEIVFTAKSSNELQDLALECDFSASAIEALMMSLTTDNYYRGIDPSGKSDFNVCAFCTLIEKERMEIYLKFGLEVDGLQILLFSNHVPKFPMNRPFIDK